jgi:hypothetical protein
MPGVNFRLLRKRNSMREVLQLLQFKPIDHRGDQWHGPCPVHGSRNPQSRSFSVNLRLGRAWFRRVVAKNSTVPGRPNLDCLSARPKTPI